MTYEALKEMGIVEERPPEITEIIALVTRAERDLSTSRLLQDKDEEWAFAAAYLAMVRSARALILNKFDRMRRKYQSFMEEAGRIISRYEAGQAIKDAEEFLGLVNGKIREKYSQMSLLNDVPQLVSR